MTKETILKKQIKQYLNLKRCFWWYNLQGMGAYKGVPDIFVYKKGMLYAIEAKAPKGKTSPYQDAFLELIKENNGVPIIAKRLEDVMEYL